MHRMELELCRWWWDSLRKRLNTTYHNDTSYARMCEGNKRSTERTVFIEADCLLVLLMRIGRQSLFGCLSDLAIFGALGAQPHKLESMAHDGIDRRLVQLILQTA